LKSPCFIIFGGQSSHFFGETTPLIFGPTYGPTYAHPRHLRAPQAISAALTACAVAIAWPSALQLFVTAGGAGHGSVRNALLGALAAAKRWEMAMELMQVEKTPGHFERRISTHGALGQCRKEAFQ